MIRKSRAIPRLSATLTFVLTLAGAASVYAQTSQPAQPQQPQSKPPQAQQQPDSNQEATVEESTPERKAKANQYKKWVYNVGGGAGLTSGNTKNFVRSGGGIAAAGVARNGSKYLGIRFDFQFDNLPLKQSALQAAQATGANSHVYTFMLDPIINIPASTNWGGYILGGPALLCIARANSILRPRFPVRPATVFSYGGAIASTIACRSMGSSSTPARTNLARNFGGGITRKIRPNMDLYVEFRFLHGKHNDISTDLRPITIGVRW